MNELRLPRRRRTGASRPGGITAPCGCRYVRTGGWWYHVTPCRVHVLREWPVSDEAAKAAMEES